MVTDNKQQAVSSRHGLLHYLRVCICIRVVFLSGYIVRKGLRWRPERLPWISWLQGQEWLPELLREP